MDGKCETGIYEFRQKYPYSETILLFTEFKNLGADNITGLIANLKQLSNLTDIPEVRKLVPKSNLSVLTNKKEVFINAVEFLAYDGEELAETLDDTSDLTIPMLTEIWQPNFFRPAIYVGSENVASGMNNANLQPFSDLAIGLPSQFCYQVNKVVQNPQDIYITASLAKAVSDNNTIRYRNYPLLAIVSIWHSLSAV